MDGEHDVGSDHGLSSFFPTSFGDQTRVSNIEAQFEQARRKGAGTMTESKGRKELRKKQEDEDGSDDISNNDSDDDSDDYSSEDEAAKFPTSHELLIKTHERAVTSATVDNSGSRLITGSSDCTLKLYDFASMTPTTVRAFKSVDPTASKSTVNIETHPVQQVLFNPISAGLVLVVTALPQAKVFDRDGEMVITCVKGDMYLRDMHNTKGHVSEVTCGDWHPSTRDLFVTAGTDSTLRIWDVKNPRSQKHVIVHKSKAVGSAARSRMTSVRWFSSAQSGSSMLASTALDGSLLVWNGDGPYNRPVAEIRDAHAPDTWTSGIDASPDGRLLVTRGGDDTIKLWDTRKLKDPVSKVAHGSTSSQYSSTNIRFSPTGTNVLTGSPDGDLHILNLATLKPELVTPVTPGSPLITVTWHEKLNQIITGSANAETHILFNPDVSTGGARAVMLKTPKRRHIDDDPNLTMDMSQGISADSIVVPGTGGPRGNDANSYAARHPTIGLTASGRSRDPRRPHMPQSTPFAKSQPDEKHVKENIPLSSMRDEDPREALLKYANKAQSDPLFTKAWKDTQPTTIYAEYSDGEEEEPDKKRVKR